MKTKKVKKNDALPQILQEFISEKAAPLLRKYFGKKRLEEILKYSYLHWFIEVADTLNMERSHENLGDVEKIFELLAKRHLRHQDKIRMLKAEMPEFFKDKPPLTQFWLSRFFLAHEEGERQVFLSKTKGLPAEKVWRMFFEDFVLEKIAQSLARWPEVPEPQREEFLLFEDHVKESDFEEVQDLIRSELPAGEIRETILKNLKREPLGSGSIGEVYVSKLIIDGEEIEVGVKGITPSKERRMRGEEERSGVLEHIEMVEILLEAYGEEAPMGTREAIRISRMMREIIENEFDLRLEAVNADKIRALIPRFEANQKEKVRIRIPEYFIITPKVAIQRLVRGKKLEQVTNSSLKRGMIQSVRNFFMFQVIEGELYHSDLQPGNILVDEESETVWLLDFGQVGTLAAAEKMKVLQFIQAYSSRQPESLVSVLKAMSESFESFQEEKLLRDTEEILSDWERKKKASVMEVEDQSSQLVARLFKAAHQRGLLIALPYLKLLKGVTTLESNQLAL